MTITGGDAWKKLFERLSGEARKTSLEVGLLEGGGGGYAEYGGMSVATIGFWHEFGTSRTPPRPFLRKALAEHGEAWGKAATAYVKGTGAAMAAPPEAALPNMLTVVGNRAVSDVKRLFASGEIGPAVSQRREMEKAKGKPESVGHPLVYSGTLSKAIAFEVKK